MEFVKNLIKLIRLLIGIPFIIILHTIHRATEILIGDKFAIRGDEYYELKIKRQDMECTQCGHVGHFKFWKD